jgi:hypothetical protein
MLLLNQAWYLAPYPTLSTILTYDDHMAVQYRRYFNATDVEYFGTEMTSYATTGSGLDTTNYGTVRYILPCGGINVYDFTGNGASRTETSGSYYLQPTGSLLFLAENANLLSRPASGAYLVRRQLNERRQAGPAPDLSHDVNYVFKQILTPSNWPSHSL